MASNSLSKAVNQLKNLCKNDVNHIIEALKTI